jgi:hypothetical protein
MRRRALKKKRDQVLLKKNSLCSIEGSLNKKIRPMGPSMSKKKKTHWP